MTNFKPDPGPSESRTSQWADSVSGSRTADNMDNSLKIGLAHSMSYNIVVINHTQPERGKRLFLGGTVWLLVST